MLQDEALNSGWPDWASWDDLTSSGGGQRRLQARLRQDEAARLSELDQPAETAALLGVMIGVDVGEIMIEEGVHEPLQDRAAIGRGLFAEPDAGEDRQHLAV